MTQAPNIQTREGQEQLRKMGVKPVPAPDDLTRPYWEAAKRKELTIQRCKACGEYRHPPQEACPECQSKETEWTKLSGKGTIYTFIIDHRLMVPGFDEPYVVMQVNPVEAQHDTVRITSNLRNCPREDAYIGMPVQVLFEERTPEVTLPQFEPAPEAKLRSKGQTP
jgi:uncharacterized OB-fold protein